MKTGTKNPLNFLIIILMSGILALSMAYLAGCKGEKAPEGGDQAEIQETVVETDTGGQTEEQDDQAGEESAGQADSGNEEQEAGEEDIEVPDEITGEIEAAEDYYSQGLYAEAVNKYRNAIRIIEDSDLPDDLKQELLDSIDGNYQDALNIADAARMHHSNAMTLMYEKRFEEAKVELEAALAIYPKYQTAIDALASLEALMGLE